MDRCSLLACLVLLVLPALACAQTSARVPGEGGIIDLESLRASGYEGPVPLEGRALVVDPATGHPALSGDPDKTVSDAPWDPTFYQPGPDRDVAAVCVFQGGLFVGGNFSRVGSVEASCLAYFDGTRWWSCEERFGFSVGTVEHLVVHDGNLVITGFVEYAGTSGRSRNIVGFDGTSLFGYGAGFSSRPKAVLDLDGTLVAGGDFYSDGDLNVTLHGLARWTGTGWAPYGSGQNGTVYALANYGGDLVIGGHFSQANGVAVSNLARWTGTTFAGFSGTTGVLSGTVYALLDHDGDLYVGGAFSSIEGVAATNLARWDGTAWTQVGGGVTGGSGNAVTCLREVGTDVLVAGRFTSAGGLGAVNAVLWDGSGFLAMGAGVGGSVNDIVNDAAIFNGEVWLGGRFLYADGAAACRIARWDGAGWSQAPAVVGHGMTDAVLALCLWNGNLIAGGQFTIAGSTLANRIARWDGTSWQPLGEGMDDAVTTLTVWNGDLIAAGKFQLAGGVSCRRIARWDGIEWHDLGGGLAQEPAALASWQGRLYVGGLLGEAGGVAVANLAAWDGAAWTSPAGGLDGRVRCLLPDGGRLLVGGEFTHAGVPAVAASRLAAWDGSSWSEFGGGADGGVYALAEYGGIVAGGKFLELGGVPCSRIGRWNGATWQQLGAGFVPSYSYDCGGTCTDYYWVTRLAVSEGRLFAAGVFYQSGTLPIVGVACWTEVEHWTTLGSGVGAETLCGDSQRLWVGGYFVPGATAFVPGSELACWRIDRIPVNGDERWWSGFDLAGFDNGLSALCTFGEGLVAAGYFTHAGDVPARGVAAWDGTSWTALGEGIDCLFSPGQTTVDVLKVWNGELYAGGLFQLPPSTDYVALAKWTGSQWEPVIGSNWSVHVRDLVPYDGDLIAVGTFEDTGGAVVSGLARYDGTNVTVVPVTLAYQGYYRILGGGAVYDGDLLVYGNFSALNGESRGSMALWDGTSWLPVPAGFGVTGAVSDVLVGDGGIYVGGDFTAAGGAPAGGIAHWNGTTWDDLGGGVANVSGSAPAVNKLTEFENAVIATGSFDMAGGAAGYARIAAWQDGAWSPLGGGFQLGTQPPITRSLAAWGSDLYVGGSFGAAGDKSSSNIARWLGTAGTSGQSPAVTPTARLTTAFPNPFNGSVSIRYDVPRAMAITLAIYDIRGRHLRTLLSGPVQAGAGVAPWDGKDSRGRGLPSGVYCVRLTAEGMAQSRKLTYVR